MANKQTGLVNVPEYVRWSQHCALGAIHRFHGGPGHQPWLYGNTTESIIRDFLNLRMSLMPTIIAAGARAHRDGTPIVRRLDIEFPTAGPNATRLDQYLLGDDTLIAPFAGGWSANGSASRSVWIPPGQWTDAWTGEVATGPQIMISHQPISRVPMFHRHGGLVVTAPPALSVDLQDWTTLILEVWPFSDRLSNHSIQREVVREGEGADDGPTHIIIMHQQADTIRLEVRPTAIDTIDQPSSVNVRSWLVRVHLTRSNSARVVTDKSSTIEDQSMMLLQPTSEGDNNFFPFRGSGAAPPMHAGPILELRCPLSADAQHVTIKIDGQDTT